MRNKNLVIGALTLACIGFGTFAFKANQSTGYEYKQITVVESIIPMGLGRSRIIEEKSPIDAKAFTTERTDGKDSQQGEIDRSDAKVGMFAETKLLNFFSGVGINFQNIASNDALITSKINDLENQGWQLEHVTSGVESVGSPDDKNGIYITRYIFKKAR
jgi:hypothetical protein